MNYCQRGREMLQDLQRSDWLPPHDDEGIRVVASELEDLRLRIEGLQRDPMNSNRRVKEDEPAGLLYSKCMYRNRRYLLSYMLHRMNKIREMRLETGPLIPARVKHDTLSSLEGDYFIKYSEVLNEHMESIKLDLSQDMDPPKEPLINVRVVENYGEVMTENGPIVLVKGATHYIRRSDVEQLIRQGILEHVRSDEF